MKKTLKFVLIVLVAALVFGCGGEKKETRQLTVSAAASLTELMGDLKPMFEKEYNVDLTVNLASSGTLQRQIEEGAPVDVLYLRAVLR